jgi:glutaredoxin
MTILFYSMQGCGYCTKAKQMFAEELASGEMIEKPAHEAGDGVNGFPHFKSEYGEHTGLPRSKEALYAKLNGDSNEDSNEDSNGALIIFYEMNGCGHCENAKKTLAENIANGQITVKPHTAAGIKAPGFPAFESVKTGSMSLGAPSSYTELLEKLGMVENFHHPKHNSDWVVGVL